MIKLKKQPDSFLKKKKRKTMQVEVKTRTFILKYEHEQRSEKKKTKRKKKKIACWTYIFWFSVEKHSLIPTPHHKRTNQTRRKKKLNEMYLHFDLYTVRFYLWTVYTNTRLNGRRIFTFRCYFFVQRREKKRRNGPKPQANKLGLDWTEIKGKK